MSNIFECKETMPPMSNSPDVVRTALSAQEAQQNLRPALSLDTKKDVVHVTRPVRGRPY